MHMGKSMATVPLLFSTFGPEDKVTATGSLFCSLTSN